MAIYHLSSQIIKRSAGRSSVAAAAYRAAAKLTDQRTGLDHDYTRKRHVDDAVIYLPATAPSAYADRATLWNAVEKKENRKDSQTAREIDVAIPVELTQPQMKNLVAGFVKQQFVDEGMIADVCYHHLDGTNPHCHIMLTMREVTKDGFGKKNRDWNDKKRLQQWRRAWESHANHALAQSGSKATIDHRTLKAQGIDRAPEKHLGTEVNQMIKRGEIPDRAVPTMLKRLRQQLKDVQNEIKRLMNTVRNRHGQRSGRGVAIESRRRPKPS